MEALAIVMAGKGGPEVLKEGRIRLDWPKDGHALVRLKCAGLNPADVYFRKFGPYFGDGAGCVLGHDGAGVVEAVGAKVARVKPGDAVCFCFGGIGADPGTYAEYAVVPERVLVGKPEGLSFEQAAALPLVFITAWEALAERARLGAGEYALIHGGAGGTGHVAVQVAKLLGARVAATVSTREKAAFVEGLGCERPILYREEDFVKAAKEWAGGRGLDVAFDNVGGKAAQKTLAAMAAYGRFVTIMGTPADTENDDAYLGNLAIVNVMMLTPMWRGMMARMAEQAKMVERGIRWLAEGKLKVHIVARYPLAEAAQAQKRLEAGGTTGKIVLAIGD